MNAPDSPRRGPPARDLAWVGLYGATTTVVAYLLSGGSLVAFIILIVVIGVLLRLAAFALVRARGERPPRGWWR